MRKVLKIQQLWYQKKKARKFCKSWKRILRSAKKLKKNKQNGLKNERQ